MVTNNRPVRLGWAWGVLLAAVAVPGRAAPGFGGASQALPELGTVVTATRYAKRVESVPANVTTITEKDIANSTARDVPTILRKEVGLHVYDITGDGLNYQLDRSGFGATAALNTLVLIDGRRINNPDSSGTARTLIPLDRVARIEIVRGSRGSVLYGDNATDGVVNIITKGGTPGFGFGLEVAGGSYNALNPSATVTGTYNDLSYAVLGRYHETDGYRDNNATEQSDIGLNLGYTVEEIAHIGLSAGYHKDETRLPGPLQQSELAAGSHRRDSTHPYDVADSTDYYVQLNPEFYLLDNSAFRIPLSYRQWSQDYLICCCCVSYIGSVTRSSIDYNSVTASPQLVVEEAIGGFDNSLTLGLDYYRADGDVHSRQSLFNRVIQLDLKKENYGLYIHDEFSATDNLVLAAGYRWDQVDYAFSSQVDYVPDIRGHMDYDEQVFSAGLNYRFRDKSHLYFSFAQGFRYPVLNELFNPFPGTISSDLRPQTTTNYELGVRHAFTDHLYGSLNLFRLDTKDELFYNPATVASENRGPQMRREGIEVTAGFDARHVSLRGSYTYRDTEIRSGAGAGNEVPNVPRHQASLDLTWRPVAGLTLALNGVHVGARYFEDDFANGFEQQDDYQVFNLKVKYAWQKYTAFLDLNNVFNAKYTPYGVLCPYQFQTEPVHYPAPEFNLFAGLRFDY